MPNELFEKCCLKWLSDKQQKGGKIAHGYKHTHTCQGGCCKIHPSITLYFDQERQKTVAVMSHPFAPFTSCFEKKEADGSASRITRLYYELDGFVRENLTNLREETTFPSHMVQPALSALDESDEAQKLCLERDYQAKKRAKQRCASDCCFDFALEICLLHRLAEDLDVMSVYSLAQTSRGMRQIACSIAKRRLLQGRLVVQPLIDGILLDGYSLFHRSHRRRASSSSTVHRENGRPVEYIVWDTPIVCTSDSDKVNRYIPQSREDSVFEWNCSELSFANLERGWGNITLSEYLGQKLLLFWNCDGVDMASLPASDNEMKLPLGTVRLDSTPSEGVKRIDQPLLSLYVRVLESNTVQQTDEVTVSFSGRAEVVQVDFSFSCLVRAYARALGPYLVAEHSRILKKRPLMDHEKGFRLFVQQALTLGT